MDRSGLINEESPAVASSYDSLISMENELNEQKLAALMHSANINSSPLVAMKNQPARWQQEYTGQNYQQNNSGVTSYTSKVHHTTVIPIANNNSHYVNINSRLDPPVLTKITPTASTTSLQPVRAGVMDTSQDEHYRTVRRGTEKTPEKELQQWDYKKNIFLQESCV
jgi:hypothetical protein